MSTSPFCSVQSREAGEGLAGTADRVDVWLMLEYRGAWRAKVVSDHDIDPATLRWLHDLDAAYRARGLTTRLQMIRQPSAGDLRLLTLTGDGVLVRSAADYAALAAAPDRSTNDVHYFVCTHGSRDLCCAEFGMPVYRALRERVGDRAWQTSHLGGHRFAANVLVTAPAVLYGRVTPTTVDELWQASEHHRLYRPLARGRTCYEPAAQAAEVLGHLDAPVERIEQLDARRWQVHFSSGSVEIESREILSLASCGDTVPKPAVIYVLASR